MRVYVVSVSIPFALSCIYRPQRELQIPVGSPCCNTRGRYILSVNVLQPLILLIMAERAPRIWGVSKSPNTTWIWPLFSCLERSWIRFPGWFWPVLVGRLWFHLWFWVGAGSGFYFRLRAGVGTGLTSGFGVGSEVVGFDPARLEVLVLALFFHHIRIYLDHLYRACARNITLFSMTRCNYCKTTRFRTIRCNSYCTLKVSFTINIVMIVTSCEPSYLKILFTLALRGHI